MKTDQIETRLQNLQDSCEYLINFAQDLKPEQIRRHLEVVKCLQGEIEFLNNDLKAFLCNHCEGTGFKYNSVFNNESCPICCGSGKYKT